MTFASVRIERGSTSLFGYLMDDGTFQFIIKGKMQVFKTLLAVWAAHTDN